MNKLFVMAITVDSPEALYAEALEAAKGDEFDNPDFFLRDDQGNIDVDGCLQFLLEIDSIPGCSIQGVEIADAVEDDEDDDED